MVKVGVDAIEPDGVIGACTREREYGKGKKKVTSTCSSKKIGTQR